VGDTDKMTKAKAILYVKKSTTLYGLVMLIGFLLIANVYLIYKNTETIERNRQNLAEAERIKVNTVEIIRNLHLLDMMLRSYALVPTAQFLSAADSCIREKDPLFDTTEKGLKLQGYQMAPFYKMKDSINAYVKITLKMREELVRGNTKWFVAILTQDPGLRAWREFKKFETDVVKFETVIAAEAQENYERALKTSYILQAILFFLAMPTLMYTAYYATKAIQFSEQLRKSQEAQFRLVEEQKINLERKVDERTLELVSQNEEIAAQNEEIAARNDQLMLQQGEIEKQRNELRDQNQELHTAKRIIETQREFIQERHDDLAREVERQTGDIRKTNLELIEHNSRLEQFAYMISHNLRAPLARFIGLSTILKYSSDAVESTSITQMMVNAAHELDHVIKDLGVILGVQRVGSQLVTEVDLPELVHKICNSLSADIRETAANIQSDFGSVTTLSTIPQYLESILTNLISNAIKYRHASRTPEILLKVRDQGEWICMELSDNGVGIDLIQSREKLFSLYQRFHFHVEGKGLGLYLVKTQVEALGGRVEVISQPGLGATFQIYFRKKTTGNRSE
jgi:signal transduction histidine kinase